MPLINCPECGKQVSDKAPTCPNCGFPLNSISSNEASSDAEGTQSDQPESVTEKQKDGSSNEAQDNNKLPDTQTKKPAQERQKKKQVVSGKMKLTAAVLGIVAVAEIAVGAMLASNIICIHKWSGNDCRQVITAINAEKSTPMERLTPMHTVGSLQRAPNRKLVAFAGKPSERKTQTIISSKTEAMVQRSVRAVER